MASDNLSPEDVRQILNSSRSEAVNAINMNLGLLLDYLIEDDAISTEVYDNIKAEKRPRDQAREFLDHVSSVGEKAFLSYKRGLKETKCDSLLQTIDAEEQKVIKQRKLQQRASWPAPTPSNPPLRRPKSWTVKNLKSYFEGSDKSSHSEHYTGRASKDDGHSASESAFRSADLHASANSFKHVQQRFSRDASVVGSDATCSITSNLPEDGVPDETTVKQVADSLNDLNIGLNASSNCSNTPQIKPVNMLLVGCKENGKSSTGNSILGEKCFMYRRRGGTTKASLGSGSFQGESEDVQWDVNVVDTPGISQEMSKSEFEEIVSGVKILSDEGSSKMTCGLDAVVLIWSYDHTDRNVQVEVQAFQSLHRLFGDSLYEYLVIAVTHAGDLSSVEEYIQELPEPLSEIEKKCSGRLVTFENKYTFEESQQSREKLCNIVYSLSKKNQCRYTTRHFSYLCKFPKGTELRLALMGKTGVGKSSTGNSIIGCEKFSTSVSAASETTDCPYYTRKKPRKVAVVDSPGVLCTDSGACDKDRLVDQLSRIAATYHTGGLHAMLLVISGRQRFTQEDKDTFQYLRAVFEDRLLRHHTIIVITGKDEIEADKKVRGDVETYLRNAPKSLQEVLKFCNERVVFFNNKTTDETIQRMQRAELIRMIDDLVKWNGGPYIDENFQEGKAVAGSIEGRSKLSTKAKSTSQLPVTSRSLTQFSFPDEKSRSDEGILLPSTERHPGSSKLQTLPKQALPRYTRAMSTSGLPTRSMSSTSFFCVERSYSEEGIHVLLPEAATESDDETSTTDLFVSERYQTPVSVAEDQLRPSDEWQSQESLDDSDIHVGASASPLFRRRSAATFPGQNATNSDITEERVRRVAALSNLRFTKLWRAIRRKLRFGNRVGPAKKLDHN